MAKLVVFAGLLLNTMVTFAEEWKPPENPNPTMILREAKADAQKRNYQTALEKQVWYHQNALKYDRGQGGVRLSFALGYWLDLAKEYPPALDRLREFQNDAEKSARKGIARTEAFHDFVAINRALGEESKTLELFLEFDKEDRKFAARAYSIANAALLEAKQYEVCGRYVDPDMELVNLRELYRMSVDSAKRFPHQDRMIVMANQTLKNNAATLVALLVANGKKDKAAEIAKSAKELRDDADYHGALDEALKGTFPGDA